MEKYDDFAQLVGQVPLGVRNLLCVGAVEQCLGFFAPSLGEHFSQVTVDYVHYVIPRLRSFAEGEVGGFDYSQLVSGIYGLQGQDDSIGISGIVGMLAGCIEAVEFPPTVSHVVEVISACYQAVLATEGIPRVTLETERQDPNLVRLIQAQLDLVRSFA